MLLNGILFYCYIKDVLLLNLPYYYVIVSYLNYYAINCVCGSCLDWTLKLICIRDRRPVKKLSLYIAESLPIMLNKYILFYVKLERSGNET